MVDSRMLEHSRQEASFWLTEYAEKLREWNKPDDEHTRLTLRALVEEVIAEFVPE